MQGAQARLCMNPQARRLDRMSADDDRQRRWPDGDVCAGGLRGRGDAHVCRQPLSQRPDRGRTQLERTNKLQHEMSALDDRIAHGAGLAVFGRHTGEFCKARPV